MKRKRQRQPPKPLQAVINVATWFIMKFAMTPVRAYPGKRKSNPGGVAKRMHWYRISIRNGGPLMMSY
jgi:hypothetical protein